MMNHRGYAQQGGAPGSSVFDPATVVTPLVLSNANATASRTVSTGNSGARVRGSLSHAGGAWYLRYNVVSASGSLTMGIGFSTAAATGYLGATGNSFGLYDGGQFYQFGTSSLYGVGFATGDLVEFCIDVTAALLWYRVNGGAWSNGGDPALGTGGIPISGFGAALFPAVEQDTPGTANSVTLDTGTASPIAGFTAWG